MSDMKRLRRAAEARAKEWDTADAGLSFAGNELAGELGEALEVALSLVQAAVAGGKASNLIKKLDRERLGIKGSTTNLDELADELGDVIVCVDIIAMKLGLGDLGEIAIRKFNKTSEKYGFKTRVEEHEAD